MKACTSSFQPIRYFGVVNKTRILDVHKEIKCMECPVCGNDIKQYMSINDTCPECATYIKQSKIRTMKGDFDKVNAFWNEHREQFHSEGKTILDYALLNSHCSTPESMGVQPHDPNDTIDERFLKRDRIKVYVPSIHGVGIDTVMMNKKQFREHLAKQEIEV